MKALEEIDRADLCDNLSPDIDSLARFGQVIPLDFRGYAFAVPNGQDVKMSLKQVATLAG